jgi:hypothetical protein
VLLAVADLDGACRPYEPLRRPPPGRRERRRRSPQARLPQPDSHHCPHGRPTSLLFTLAELGNAASEAAFGASARRRLCCSRISGLAVMPAAPHKDGVVFILDRP